MTTLNSESYIEVSGTNDATGQNKKLETIKVTDENGDTVHREMVAMGGILDAANTSTTALGGGETYTGAWVRVPDGVQVSCKSDVAGTLYFDFSNDKTNVDTFPPSGFTVSANIHEYHNAKTVWETTPDEAKELYQEATRVVPKVFQMGILSLEGYAYLPPIEKVDFSQLAKQVDVLMALAAEVEKQYSRDAKRREEEDLLIQIFLA